MMAAMAMGAYGGHFDHAFSGGSTAVSGVSGDPFIVASAGGPTVFGHGSYSPIAGKSMQFPDDQIRTVFITGFPTDMKERELHNLCRFLPGYEASQV